MNQRFTSRILPFGDKFAMLVVVFLILSLGFGVASNRSKYTSNISVPPSLVTLRQTSAGPLGIEKLIYLNVRESYFLDKPKVYPTGLSGRLRFSKSKLFNVIGREPSADEILNYLLGEGGPFSSSSRVTRSNTGLLTQIKLYDDEVEVEHCMKLLKQKSAAIVVEGECRQVSDTRFADEWKQIVSHANGEEYRCIHSDCLSEEDDVSVSFSGVLDSPWNGAAVTFSHRKMVVEPLTMTGIMCYLDPNGQISVADQLNTIRSTKKNLISEGENNFWLFEGDEGADYLQTRLEDNMRTELILSSFIPGSSEVVNVGVVRFSGYIPGQFAPDGILFSDTNKCRDMNNSVKRTEAKVEVATTENYEHHILQLFEITIVDGDIVRVSGVEESRGSNEEDWR